MPSTCGCHDPRPEWRSFWKLPPKKIDHKRLPSCLTGRQLAPVRLDMAATAERCQVGQVEGSAALLEGLDMVGFQAPRTAALNAPPAVALEYLAADRLPLRTRRRESAHPSGSCLSTGTQLSEMV